MTDKENEQEINNKSFIKPNRTNFNDKIYSFNEIQDDYNYGKDSSSVSYSEKLFLKGIYIKNFKSIKNLQIQFDRDFNVIIGENSIGKTTIIEAIMLWKACYDIHIQRNKNKKFYRKSQTLPFKNLDFLRVNSDKELFFSENHLKKQNNGNQSLEIELLFLNKDEHYTLGFKINEVGHVESAYFQVNYLCREEFDKFSNTISKMSKNLHDAINIIESKPISRVITEEPYMYKNQIKRKVRKGKNYDVLRNKIVNSKKSISSTLSEIMDEEIEFIEPSNRTEDEFVKVYLKRNGLISHLSSQGSGFIQMTELFSSIEQSEALLTILLIDEPDAHLNGKLRIKLIEKLQSYLDKQIFVITHNEKIIEKIPEEQIILVDEDSKNSGEIKSILKNHKNLVLNALYEEVDSIEKLKMASRVFFVEGPKDKKALEKLSSKYNEFKRTEISNFSIIAIKGLDNGVIKFNVFNTVFRSLGVSKIPKSALLDTDFMNDEHKEKLKKDLSNQMHGLNIMFQEGYELHSTVFNDIEKLISLLNHYYETDVSEKVRELIQQYHKDINSATSGLYNILHDNCESQLQRRNIKDKTNQVLTCLIKKVNDSNQIAYIMTKNIINSFLSDVHEDVKMNMREDYLKWKKLDSEKLFDIYLDNINQITDFYPWHLEILDELYS